MNLSRAFMCQGISVLLAAVAAISVSGCNDDPIILPEGVQVLTGTLLPTDISLLRRGTHVLRIEDTDTYYVESTHENLSKYEQKLVVLEGTLSHNVESSFLPVLDVLRVVDVLGDTQKLWEIRSLNLSLSVPEAWRGEIKEGSAIFIAPGGSEPIVSIERSISGSMVDTTGGVPIVLGNTRAIRVIDEATGKQMVKVEREDSSIIFFFTPGDHSNVNELRADWLTILSTVSFRREVQTPNDPIRGSGSAVGGHCGGTAGILCAAGQYCDVTNLQENIGVCKRL